MPYDKIYSCKPPKSRFKLSILRNKDSEREPEVVRIHTKLDDWVPTHICSRHYEITSPDELYRALVIYDEDESEEELKQTVFQYAANAIEEINKMAIMH